MTTLQRSYETKEELDFLRRTKLGFDKAIQFVNAEIKPIEKGVIEFLQQPFRQLTVRFPVQMDDGSVQNVHRVQSATKQNL
jgi:glutamate dehydrogenase/leucine dehydrogenase